MLVLDFNINGQSERAQRITKHEVIIQVSLVRLVNYTTVHVKAMVTQATSYDVLVGGVVLYLLGVTLDFWEEIAYYQPR
jgi:hypothetical protein